MTVAGRLCSDRQARFWLSRKIVPLKPAGRQAANIEVNMGDLLWIIIILGLVEGITEFLPISSTGHLILVGHWLDYSGPKAQTFEIAIQTGAILAVVWKYRDVFIALCHTTPEKKFSGWHGCWLLFLTTAPAALLGLVAYKTVKGLFTPTHVALALIIGGILLLAIERKNKPVRFTNLDAITPQVALQIGLWQCLALWPGFSRSAAAIVGSMLAGMERRLAAEYSFLAGVPLLLAATGYELLKQIMRGNWTAADSYGLLLGGAVAFVAALAAVHGFIKLLSSFTMAPFGYYRIFLGIAVLLVL